ncbi:MAG: hypothetical protein Q9M13_07205 [Mariprofundales bacterium]|nr:hypothetical protein [Mariprofundales bacterium]
MVSAVPSIIFTIDALLDSGRRAWRMSDGRKRWRSATFAEDMQRDDAMLTDIGSVEEWLGVRMRQNSSLGLVAQGRSGLFNFLQRGIFTHAVIHRTSSAPLPDREQMCSVLADMEVGCAQILYLDLVAIFRSRPATQLINNPTIAVRGEVASSAQFIGVDAADNSAYTSMLWQQFTAGWLHHLGSRRTNCFIPNLEQAPPAEESLRRIEQFVPETSLCLK